MTENLIIFNTRVVTPIGFSARRGREMEELCIIDNATVEVTDGIITYVGPGRGEERDGYYQRYWHYNARGKCLLPGFVDSHTHFVFGGERAEEFSWRLRGESYMSIMERGGGIVSTVKATRACNFIQLRSKAESFLKQMSAMGVTTVEGKSGYGLDKETELLQLRVMRSLNNDEHKRVDVVSTFLGAHAVPAEYNGRTDEYVDYIIREVMPVVVHNNLAEFCDVFCEQGVFSIEQSRRLLLAAKEMGLALKLHADEIVPLGGAGLAAELSAVSADHLLHASDADIRAMADKGVVATLLPLTAFALKEPYARGREMIDAGCAVALATDLNPGSCFSGSIPLTFALACIYMKMSIEEAITALTLNGAAALNRADSIGSIEVGKKGDFVVLNTDNYHFLPYYVGMNCVNTTIKGGVLYPESLIFNIMLVDLTVKEFLNKVAGSDPVPGGGSIAALNGAIASALAAMVANLTIGKKGYELHEELMRHISGVALQQKGAFVEDIDRDSEAYDKVFACFKMPKATDEEKAARSTAIQAATKFAALVPMQVARNAYELMTVIMDVARLGNRNAVTDACVAMMSARSAVLGALMNVRINLGSLKDKEFVSKLQSEADELEHLACAKEKELLDEINQELKV